MAGPLSRIIIAAQSAAALVAAMAWGCNRKTEPPAPRTVPAVGNLAIEARLVEIPSPFPANELYNYVYIMKYRVQKVLRGRYADSVILVGHYNPRFSRAGIQDDLDSLVDGNLTSFQAGDTHALALSDLDSLGISPAVEDNYPRDPHRRFFARWAGK